MIGDCTRIDLISDEPRDYEQVMLVAAEYGLESRVFLSLSNYIIPTRRNCWIVARLTLRDGTGEDLMRQMRSKSVDVPVIFLRGDEPISQIERIQKFGYHIVLQTPVTGRELAILMSDHAPQIVAESSLVQSTLDANRILLNLGPFDRQILNAAIQGKQNKTAAALLGVSLRTLERRRNLLLKKLHITSHDEMVVIAIRSEYAKLIMPQDLAGLSQDHVDRSVATLHRRDGGHGARLISRGASSENCIREEPPRVRN